MRYLIIFLIVLFGWLVNSNAEDTAPEFMKRMTTQELDEWNDIHLQLNIATQNKDFEKALTCCKKIKDINVTSGLIAYADTYRIMGKYKEAIVLAEKAITSAEAEKLPTETPLLIMSSSYALIGEEEESKKTLDQIIRLYPEQPLAYKYYAEYYEQIGDNEKALHYWQEALKRFTDERAIQQAKDKIKSLETQKN